MDRNFPLLFAGILFTEDVVHSTSLDSELILYTVYKYPLVS